MAFPAQIGYIVPYFDWICW